MKGKWFQTRGEAIRTFAAICAGCAGLIVVLRYLEVI